MNLYCCALLLLLIHFFHLNMILIWTKEENMNCNGWAISEGHQRLKLASVMGVRVGREKCVQLTVHYM